MSWTLTDRVEEVDKLQRVAALGIIEVHAVIHLLGVGGKVRSQPLVVRSGQAGEGASEVAKPTPPPATNTELPRFNYTSQQLLTKLIKKREDEDAVSSLTVCTKLTMIVMETILVK